MIKINGHYDSEKWDEKKLKNFIHKKMQILKGKADIELLQINGNKIDVWVYVSDPYRPHHTVKWNAEWWLDDNDITKQDGLFIDELTVEDTNFRDSVYIVVGHYNG